MKLKRIFKVNKITLGKIIMLEAAVVIGFFIIFLSLPSEKALLFSQKNIQSQAVILTKKCYTIANWRECYGRSIAGIDNDIDKNYSLAYGIALIKTLQNFDKKTRDCHILAHRLMAAEIEKNPSRWSELLRHISYNECNYGYVHGIIEGMARFEKDFVLDKHSIPQICDFITRRDLQSGVDQSCAHIMGHVLLAEKQGSISEGITVCSELPKELQYQCFGGVFMENFTRDNLVAHGVADYIPWDQDHINKQEKICRSYTGLSAKGCWLEISHMYNAEYPYQPENVYKLCLKAPTKEMQDACYMHGVVTLNQKEDPSDKYLLSLCNVYEEDLENFRICMGTYITSLLFGSIKSVDETLHYCTIIPRSYRSFCYSSIGFWLRRLVSRAEQKNICSAVPVEYKNNCIGKS